MQTADRPDEKSFNVVRLGWGATGIVILSHFCFTCLNRLFLLWVAITPAKDPAGLTTRDV